MHNMHPTGWLSVVQKGGFKDLEAARRNQEEANGLRGFVVNLMSNAPETPLPGRAESTDLRIASSRLMSQTLLTTNIK